MIDNLIKSQSGHSERLIIFQTIYSINLLVLWCEKFKNEHKNSKNRQKKCKNSYDFVVVSIASHDKKGWSKHQSFEFHIHDFVFNPFDVAFFSLQFQFSQMISVDSSDIIFTYYVVTKSWYCQCTGKCSIFVGDVYLLKET